MPNLPDVGTTLGGKYRLTKIIGTGGMGAVYLARHETFDEDVAVKVLLPALACNEEARGRFEREARILFKLKSPRVCRVFDVGTDGDVPFMVMELLRGRDLAQQMEERRRFDLETALEITLQLCEAIAEAHVREVVHRDLKPENVFLVDGEALSVKLLDFGLSKDKSSKSGGGGGRGRKLTGTQQVFGTPYYMAPEQWIASGQVGPAADQWAIGAILYEMLSGKPPFYADAFAAVCTSILHDPTPSIHEVRPDVPPGLDAALVKALERDPRHRFSHVGAMALALAAFARKAGPRAERLCTMLDALRTEDPSIVGLPAPRRSRGSDMQATVPNVRSAVSSHAWESGMDRSHRARAAVAVGAGMLVATVLGGAFLSTRTEVAHVARVGLVPPLESGPAVATPPADPALEEDAEPSPAAPASAAPSDLPAAKPAPPPRRRPLVKPRPRRPAPPPPPTSIFDDR